MNLNLTLVGQMITFTLFVWVTMKYVWPLIMQAMNERQAKIADGLAAGERGQHELELAQQKATDILRDAKQQAAEIVEQSHRQAAQVVEESKGKAKQVGARQIEIAQAEITQEFSRAKQVLRKQVADVAIRGAEKILQRNLDSAANSDLINKLIEEI